MPAGAEDAASLFQVISRRLPERLGHPDHQPQRRSLGRHLLRPPPSPQQCWTGYCTEASFSPSQETATGYAPTTPRPENTDRKEAPARLTNTPRVGNFDDRLWGISLIVNIVTVRSIKRRLRLL